MNIIIIKSGGFMKTSEDYSLKYTLSERDYLNLNKWYNKKNIILLIVIFLFFYILNIILDYKNITAGIYKNLISNTLFIIVLIFLSISILKLIIKRRSKVIYRHDKILKSAIELKINNEKITEKTEKSNMELSWEDLYKTIIRKNHIYFLISKNRCIILPVREIKDQKLMDLIKSKAVR